LYGMVFKTKQARKVAKARLSCSKKAHTRE
jgi:hypothetical protein